MRVNPQNDTPRENAIRSRIVDFEVGRGVDEAAVDEEFVAQCRLGGFGKRCGLFRDCRKES
jgi:hypothetical protein